MMKSREQFYKTFHIILVILFLIMVIARSLYNMLYLSLFLPIYISCLTTILHILIRIFIGKCVQLFCENIKFNYNNFWFKQRRYENKLYEILHIKFIKDKVITANPNMFDIKDKKLEEVVHYMTIAEIDHEIMALASFIPCILIFFYGSKWIFIITSIIASFVDLLHVFIQRYNRPRVLYLIELRNKIQHLTK